MGGNKVRYIDWDEKKKKKIKNKKNGRQKMYT